MRILIVINSLSEHGGAEFVAFQWARYLAQVGDGVTVYTTHPQADEKAPEGVSLVTARNGSVAAQTRDLARYLKSQQMDIVIALMPYCNLVSISAVRSLRARRPKVAISARTLSHGRRDQSGRSLVRGLLARFGYRFADLFVAISHPVAAESIAEYGLSEDRVVVVPNPAIAKMQGRMGSPKRGIGDPGHLDLVVPARLVPDKRPWIAVDVAAAVASAFERGVTLHFFGVGPLEGAIISRARQAGVKAVMHGWVEDWFDDCPTGSVVLLPSTVEGFGNVLVEAAAAGFKSVVSSRCMGSADAVVPGITGELIAGDSVGEYAAAVLATARDPVRGIEPWLRRFSFEGSGGVLRAALTRAVTPV